MKQRTLAQSVIATILLGTHGLALLAPSTMPVVPRVQAASRPFDAQTEAAHVARVDRELASLARAHQFSGSVLIAHNGAVLLSKGYGMADYALQVRNTSTTQFLGPPVQEFSTVAVLQLMEQGKLHERDHLCEYLPHCPAAWSAITMNQLLNWTAGFHDNFISDFYERGLVGQPITLAHLVSLLEHEPLDFRPGTGCCSETAAAPIEEYVVERISGQPFGVYLRQHVLAPLGLTKTGFFSNAPPPLPHHAIGYPSWQNPYPFNTDLSIAGGQMYTTVEDLFRWNVALHAGKVLSPAWTARLFTPSFISCSANCTLEANPGQPEPTAGRGKASLIGISYGWIIEDTGYGRRVFLGGQFAGFAGLDEYYLSKNAIVIMLRNVVGDMTFYGPNLESILFG